jgi:hypothetical protein
LATDHGRERDRSELIRTVATIGDARNAEGASVPAKRCSSFRPTCPVRADIKPSPAALVRPLSRTFRPFGRSPQSAPSRHCCARTSVWRTLAIPANSTLLASARKLRMHRGDANFPQQSGNRALIRESRNCRIARQAFDFPVSKEIQRERSHGASTM